MSTPRTYQVTVHKANLALMPDESLQSFACAVKNAGNKHVAQKYNVDTKKGCVYPVEVYADKAVFMVVPDFDKPPAEDFYVAAKFARDNAGNFEFSETMKVKRVTQYMPESPMPVTKAADSPERGTWAGVL